LRASSGRGCRTFQFRQLYSRTGFNFVEESLQCGILRGAALLADGTREPLQLNLSQFASQEGNLDLVEFVEQPPCPLDRPAAALGRGLYVLKRQQRRDAHDSANIGHRACLSGGGCPLCANNPEAIAAARRARGLGGARLREFTRSCDLHGFDARPFLLVTHLAPVKLAAWLTSGSFCLGISRHLDHLIFDFIEYFVWHGSDEDPWVILRPKAKMRLVRLFTVLCIAAGAFTGPALAKSRIKDIVEFEGVRENQLVGYGIVVGLNGTGDALRNAPFTKQSLEAMLERLGVNVRDANLNTKNVAAVMVTAKLPAFAAPGAQIDATVSALGDAESLLGGTLLVTPLLGAGSEAYAVAQGTVQTGSVSAGGASGSSVTKGVPTAGRIAGGAIVERELGFQLASMGQLRMTLRNPDFTTARRIAEAVNAMFPGSANAENPTIVAVRPPAGLNLIGFMAQIENLSVESAPAPARTRLIRATEAFDAVLARQGRAVAAAQTVTEGLVKFIAEEVARQRSHATVYSACGLQSGRTPATAITLNRRA